MPVIPAVGRLRQEATKCMDRHLCRETGRPWYKCWRVGSLRAYVNHRKLKVHVLLGETFSVGNKEQ
jgi:hypothetical protein